MRPSSADPEVVKPAGGGAQRQLGTEVAKRAWAAPERQRLAEAPVMCERHEAFRVDRALFHRQRVPVPARRDHEPKETPP